MGQADESDLRVDRPAQDTPVSSSDAVEGCSSTCPRAGSSGEKAGLTGVETLLQILDGLSGDEVDPKNIITGGRGTRRGRGGAGASRQYTFDAKKEASDDDSW